MDKSVNSMLTHILRSDNKTVPTHHEAVSNLGPFLAETVLHEMSPMAKRMMGIDKPFPVAPKTVWLSPADRMAGKFVLKPPPSDDVIKAFTHEGILEIGSTVEQKLEKHFQDRIKAVKKEVEDFERFECNNRIKFALEQEKLAHENILKQQQLDLLKVFQKDHDKLIEQSRTELETLEKKLVGEHEIKREKDVKTCVEQTKLSANQKIEELTERIQFLEDELQDMQEMVNVEVRKRKDKDWQILHEIFVEIQRQFTTKLALLHNQHNAELRQLYLDVKTQRVDSEQTNTFNEDPWEDNDESLISELEQEKIDFSPADKPFVIDLCKVEGESSDDDKLVNDEDHSTCSSFKCHKHRSMPKSDNVYGEQAALHSQLLYTDSQIVDLNDINTTDISCNILRRLGMNFNMANIEKVKVELDDLLLNVNKRGETKLLTATDSLDLFVGESVGRSFGIPRSKESVQGHLTDREEYKRIMNRKKSNKLDDTKLAIPLTVDEYMNTLAPIPKYMATTTTNISIWDYKAMSDEEWNNLLQELDDKLQQEANEVVEEITSKSKTVTVTSPTSLESLTGSGKIASNSGKKPVRGILRPSVENKIDGKSLLDHEVFQTDQMQTLVGKLCNE